MERFTEGFVALDLRGRMIFLTDRAARLLGRDRAELLDAELWDVLPWLDDPAYENAFVAALFSRQPTGFAARRPDGAWLSFLLYPDATGISIRVRPGDAPDSGQEPAEDTLPTAPARAGTLFHLLHLASALTEATGVNEVPSRSWGRCGPSSTPRGWPSWSPTRADCGWWAHAVFPPDMPEHFDGLPMATQERGHHGPWRPVSPASTPPTPSWCAPFPSTGTTGRWPRSPSCR